MVVPISRRTHIDTKRTKARRNVTTTVIILYVYKSESTCTVVTTEPFLSYYGTVWYHGALIVLGETNSHSREPVRMCETRQTDCSIGCSLGLTWILSTSQKKKNHTTPYSEIEQNPSY